MYIYYVHFMHFLSKTKIHIIYSISSNIFTDIDLLHMFYFYFQEGIVFTFNKVTCNSEGYHDMQE